jgi:hypothetical protein
VRFSPFFGPPICFVLGAVADMMVEVRGKAQALSDVFLSHKAVTLYEKYPKESLSYPK